MNNPLLNCPVCNQTWDNHLPECPEDGEEVFEITIKNWAEAFDNLGYRMQNLGAKKKVKVEN